MLYWYLKLPKLSLLTKLLPVLLVGSVYLLYWYLKLLVWLVSSECCGAPDEVLRG